MRRGDIVTVALQGDLGKPRPALIVETDTLSKTDHVLVCPGTSHLIDNSPNRRLLALPDETNGLRQPTQFQIDKTTPARRDRCSAVIGRLGEDDMAEISARLMVLLGLAD